MYHHKIRGDVLGDPVVVPGHEQRRALEALLETIRPESLALPDGLLGLIPPRPPSYEETKDLFPGRTGRTFDSLAAAETAAGITVRLLLHPERAARLVEYHSRDPEAPGFGEVVDRLILATWKTTHEDRRHAEIQRVVDGIVLYNLVKLAKDESATSQVRSIAHLKLRGGGGRGPEGPLRVRGVSDRALPEGSGQGQADEAPGTAAGPPDLIFLIRKTSLPDP